MSPDVPLPQISLDDPECLSKLLSAYNPLLHQQPCFSAHTPASFTSECFGGFSFIQPNQLQFSPFLLNNGHENATAAVVAFAAAAAAAALDGTLDSSAQFPGYFSESQNNVLMSPQAVAAAAIAVANAAALVEDQESFKIPESRCSSTTSGDLSLKRKSAKPRDAETCEEAQARRKREAERQRARRAGLSQQQRDNARQLNAERQRIRRSNMTSEEKKIKNALAAERKRLQRALESESQRLVRQEADRLRRKLRRIERDDSKPQSMFVQPFLGCNDAFNPVNQ